MTNQTTKSRRKKKPPTIKLKAPRKKNINNMTIILTPDISTTINEQLKCFMIQIMIPTYTTIISDNKLKLFHKEYKFS